MFKKQFSCLFSRAYISTHTLNVAYQLIFTIDKILILIRSDEATCVGRFCVSMRCSRCKKNVFHNPLNIFICMERKHIENLVKKKG